MNKKNGDLRQRIIQSGRSYGEVADAVGVSEGTIFRWLRHELTQEQRKQIDHALEILEVA